MEARKLPVNKMLAGMHYGVTTQLQQENINTPIPSIPHYLALASERLLTIHLTLKNQQYTNTTPRSTWVYLPK